jgi:hypothetical protein
MRRLIFTISGETEQDEKRFEDAVDLAAEKVHDDHKNVSYSVRYENASDPTGDKP